MAQMRNMPRFPNEDKGRLGCDTCAGQKASAAEIKRNLGFEAFAKTLGVTAAVVLGVCIASPQALAEDGGPDAKLQLAEFPNSEMLTSVELGEQRAVGLDSSSFLGMVDGLETAVVLWDEHKQKPSSVAAPSLSSTNTSFTVNGQRR